MQLPCSDEELARVMLRAAYVKEVIRVKCLCPADTFCECAKRIDWSDVRGKSFAVRACKVDTQLKTPTPMLESMLGWIVKSRSGARVDLKNPDIVVRLIIAGNWAIIGYLISVIRASRLKVRSPEKRPFFHPSAMTPQLSRLLVNISKPAGGVVLDPFCGTGSLLLEAATDGIYAVGIDIDPRMARGARLNADHYGLRSLIDVVVADASMLPIRYEAVGSVATDPPYGRLSSVKSPSPEKLYKSFRNEALRILIDGGRLVYMYPKESIIEEKMCMPGLAYNMSVHSALTRVIRVEVKNIGYHIYRDFLRDTD